MPDLDCYLHRCLYFTANRLCRAIGRLADEAFMPAGLSPSHAFLLMLAIETPGIGPKSLSDALHLAPSTVTRFIDALVGRGLIERRAQGKTVSVFPTEQGLAMQETIAAAWRRLHERYCAILGAQAGDDLARRIDLAVGQIEGE